MQAIIMAGGKGTRLSSITNDEIPKSMVCLKDKPILEYQIECLKRNKIIDIFIVIGHLGEKIRTYFGDGNKWGVYIKYVEETTPLGTAGAFYYLKEDIKDNCLFLLGDLICDIYVDRFLEFHNSKKSIASLLVHPNSHPFDSDVVRLDCEQKVTDILKKNTIRDEIYGNLVNAGVYIINKKILEQVKKPIKTDFESDIIIPLIQENDKVFGYISTEYVKDVGTPDRLAIAEKDIESGIVSKKNLINKQKCVFLDRDGTINKYVGLVSCPDQLELEENVGEALGRLNKSEYLSMLVTNQPVVARGMCTIDDVKKINNKLELLLGDKGTYLDAITFCPHHPDKGYEGENEFYKTDCECRKPKTGMIKELAKLYNVDLEHSWIIGDTTVDIMTGKNAGLHTILVKTGMAGQDEKYDILADYEADNLLKAVDIILSKEV
jgi:histidinol-phosphate phosphatase domain